jgi:Na+/pantothenate symporter
MKVYTVIGGTFRERLNKDTIQKIYIVMGGVSSYEGLVEDTIQTFDTLEKAVSYAHEMVDVGVEYLEFKKYRFDFSKILEQEVR